eukprot:CAMPEP_0116131054 /NCGR_PEP_ID=MMETSP0329-20121206/8804_1 /TAXON_ID=697910 /ORGANISM="Pseudo-nitzschia arenysensis, Strain B593" /LENGTH=372 /DNA_ID=CAMNT_0003625465 /DNA_START=290 /DNA_END=1408 /DNA_ORIENTATION=-
MLSNTAFDPPGSHADADADHLSSIGHEETSRDSSSSNAASPVPEWKDDGDESICESLDEMEAGETSYEIHRIPSTLEFILTDEQTDDSEVDQRPHHRASHSSLTYSSSQMNMIDADATSSVQRNSFRRRLNSAVDCGSIETNPLCESQSLTTSQTSVSTARFTILGKSRQRFTLLLGAIVLVMLSTHDNMTRSRQYYRQQYELASDMNIRREEIAFPLVQEQVHSDRMGTTEGGGAQSDQETNGNPHQKADLPKFYFSKVVDPANPNRIRGSAGHSGSNLAMARPQKPRPVFVPDTPLPDGGFKKPLERFVFDSSTRERTEEQQRRKHDASSSSSSWTSMIASLALVTMLLDTGRKEYQRYRFASIPSSRDE